MKNPTNRIEKWFSRALRKINMQLLSAIKNEEDPVKIVQLLRQLANTPNYIDYCQEISMKMVTQVNKEVLKTWREAAAKSSKGKTIYSAILKELRNFNSGTGFTWIASQTSKLIITLPQIIAEEVTKYVQQNAIEGRRASEIAKEITLFFPEKTTANAELIARTEVSKTQMALTQARAERLGINWYIWRTSEDSRVRNSHDVMKDVLVNWKDPPSPEKLDSRHKGKTYGRYHAGNIFNCRCYAEPVISFDTIKFPCKVYSNGQIYRMTKKQFLAC